MVLCCALVRNVRFCRVCERRFVDQAVNVEFRRSCNLILERELSGYRFIGELLAPVTSAVEMQAIDAASLSPFKEARDHLARALELLSDRRAPDYRNSIKESVSAVEAVARKLTGDKRATLSAAVRKIDTLHPALRSASEKLYAYTSDESGIRHALIEEGRPADLRHATFMLVVCSAFVSFVAAELAE